MTRRRVTARVAALAGIGACLAVVISRPPEGAGAAATSTLARFLLAVAVVVGLCHLCGALFVRLALPRVVGEIVGGLLLGPTAFGSLWPAGRDWLFPAEVIAGIHLAAELGVVVFMFLLGCELQPGHLRQRRAAVGLIVIGAMGLPFLAGAGLAWAGHDLIAGPAHPPAAHIVFFGLALSVTALPVLARILADLGRERTPLGTLALTCAAAGDGATWATLTILFGIVGVGAGGDPAGAVALAAALVLATMAFVRPALRALVRRLPPGTAAARTLLPVLVAGALGYAGLAELVGLHPVIGAFLFGLVVPRDSEAVAHVHMQLRGFAVMILLPLFFAGVGLHTAIGALGGGGAWLLFAGVLVAAVGAKLVGAGVAGRLAGLSTRESLQLGALMNCRGVTELVVIAVGFEYQLISAPGLTVLVLMALVTTALTGPLLRLFESWPPVRPRPVGAASTPATTNQNGPGRDVGR